MEFKKAYLSVLDPESYRYGKTVAEFTAGKKGEDGRKARTWVEVYPTNNTQAAMPTHMVRYYSGHVEPHCEGPTVLDWHEVWGGTVAIIGERLVLTGFSQGATGKIWDGHPDPNNFDEHFDFTAPFVGVEWVFHN